MNDTAKSKASRAADERFLQLPLLQSPLDAGGGGRDIMRGRGF